jgi:hypothetical protein
VDDAADVRAEAVVGEPRRRLGLEALNEEAR